MTEGITIDYVFDLAWAHSHGMAARGLPELEIRGVPRYFAGAAADLLNGVCDYMIRTGNRVKAGETMASNGAVFRFAASEPIPGHEDPPGVERLRIEEVELPCDCCGADEDERPPITVGVAYEQPEDPEVARRVAELSGRSGGEEVGRRETVLTEEVEVHGFGFDTADAAEAFARACEQEEGVRYVWTSSSIKE